MALSGQVIKPLVEIPEDANECWEWKGSINKRTGYGKKQLMGKSVLAHRWAYEGFVGPIEPDKVINHKCSNRSCVNPAHLEVVTQADNCRHGRGSKLTRIQAKTVKRLRPYKVKGLQHELAARYNVSRQLINDIWSGRAWKDL